MSAKEKQVITSGDVGTLSTLDKDAANVAKSDAGAAKNPGLKFKVLSHVTRPVLAIPENGSPVYVRIEGEIYTAKELKKPRVNAAGTAEKPPQLVDVIDLQTGEAVVIVVGTVLEDSLKDKYPDASYIGKSFQIVKKSAKEGKRHKLYQIAEIEVE